MKPNKVKPYETAEAQIGLAEEAPMAYHTGSRTIPLNLLTSVQKMDISKQGISKRYLESFKKEVALDYPTLADALSVTRATLINKKGDQKFNEQVSERIVSLADLYAFGYEVFESRTRFNEWMSTPNHALGGTAPIHVMHSYYGREEVRNIIGRIAYGVYS